MLFGKTPEEAAASMMPAILGDGFGQSVAMIGHALGFDLDAELAVSHEVAVATAPIDSPIGPIAPGRVAAQKFRWEATVGRRAGDHRSGPTGSWARTTSTRPGRSGPRASGSRSR